MSFLISPVVEGFWEHHLSWKQYLIHQKMILITIPCQKNDREDLRGEKVSALEDNKCLCQNPATTGRDWPEWSSILGTLLFPVAERTLFDSSMVLNTSTLWNGSLIQDTSRLPVSFPVREFIVLVMKILIQWSQKPKTGNHFLSTSVNKTTSTCLKWFLKHFFKLFDTGNYMGNFTGDKTNFSGFNSFFYSWIKQLQDGWKRKSLFQWQKVF